MSKSILSVAPPGLEWPYRLGCSGRGSVEPVAEQPQPSRGHPGIHRPGHRPDGWFWRGCGMTLPPTAVASGPGPCSRWWRARLGLCCTCCRRKPSHEPGCLARRLLFALVFLAVGVIHLLPATGVLGQRVLERAYGVALTSPDLVVLMQHRALMFTLLGIASAVAAWQPAWRLPVGIAALVSMLGFVLIAAATPHGAAIQRVVVGGRRAAPFAAGGDGPGVAVCLKGSRVSESCHARCPFAFPIRPARRPAWRRHGVDDGLPFWL